MSEEIDTSAINSINGRKLANRVRMMGKPKDLSIWGEWNRGVSVPIEEVGMYSCQNPKCKCKNMYEMIIKAEDNKEQNKILVSFTCPFCGETNTYDKPYTDYIVNTPDLKLPSLQDAQRIAYIYFYRQSYW